MVHKHRKASSWISNITVLAPLKKNPDRWSLLVMSHRAGVFGTLGKSEAFIFFNISQFTAPESSAVCAPTVTHTHSHTHAHYLERWGSFSVCERKLCGSVRAVRTKHSFLRSLLQVSCCSINTTLPSAERRCSARHLLSSRVPSMPFGSHLRWSRFWELGYRLIQLDFFVRLMFRWFFQIVQSPGLQHMSRFFLAMYLMPEGTVQPWRLCLRLCLSLSVS